MSEATTCCDSKCSSCTATGCGARQACGLPERPRTFRPDFGIERPPLPARLPRWCWAMLVATLLLLIAYAFRTGWL